MTALPYTPATRADLKPGTDRELFLARCDAWLKKDAEGGGA